MQKNKKCCFSIEIMWWSERRTWWFYCWACGLYCISRPPYWTVSTKYTIRLLLLSHFQKRSSFTYRCIVTNKRKFDRRLLAQVYNSMILPHYLYLRPFWRIFTATDKLKLRSLYYKYAKLLLRLPPWTSNRYVTHQYRVANHEEAIRSQIDRYNSSVKTHPLTNVLQQKSKCVSDGFFLFVSDELACLVLFCFLFCTPSVFPLKGTKYTHSFIGFGFCSCNQNFGLLLRTRYHEWSIMISLYQALSYGEIL